DVDLILDGTDNFATRYVINDISVKLRIPWVYGACVGATGSTLPILPGETPCLRCIFPTMPAAEESPSCDAVGVLSPIVHWVAAQQSMNAIKLLSGNDETLVHEFVSMDCWTGRIARVSAQAKDRNPQCPCCADKRFEFLDGPVAARTTVLCGRNAIQLTPLHTEEDARRLERIAGKLPKGARSNRNAYLLRFAENDLTVTIFADGRTIVQGTEDPGMARAIFAKYVEIPG
ncbi:MAG: ThiF family adenylyltransferase, partial [Phycisphaerae bacterium]